MMIALGTTMSSVPLPHYGSADYLQSYLRQVEQSIRAGNMTLAEQQIAVVEQRLHSGVETPPLAGPVLRTVQQYVSQVSAQIRMGDLTGAEHALITTRQYASQVVNAAR